MSKAATKPFTGYHMAAILIGFFGIVMAVNFYMARMAIGTFGGTVVDNSYVASQNYNDWLAEAARQQKLGWAVTADRLPDGRVQLTITDNGLAAVGFTVTATAEHPLRRTDAELLQFTSQGDGSYLSATPLPTGRRKLRLQVRRDGALFRQIVELP